MTDSILMVIVKRVALLLVAAALATVVWIAVLEGMDVIRLVGKRPWDVWQWLFVDADAAENRAVVFGNLLITMRDAVIGYAIGLTFSFLVAVVFVMSRAVEQVVIPPVMLARSIPLLVMTPLITLVFGINLIGVSAVVTAIVFFPALINLVYGLRTVNPQHVELVRAHGGSTWTVVRKVSIPGSLPALFASARLSVPLAVTGAMIGEWLATGEGLGGSISRAAGKFDFNQMWASAVTITAVTMLAYTVVSVVEALVVRRYGAAGE
jgi:ABC-type nitrate/sulfonate/bicarbonate transport system permease component